MIVLIACEESQIVCKAFRAKGHEAYSCDIQECSGGHPEWHIQGDAIDILYSKEWDLVIAHPPCTRLANSGVCHLKKGLWRDLKEGMNFFKEFVEYGINNKIAVENPIPHKYARDGFFLDNEKGFQANDFTENPERISGIGKYSQIFQPYHFGHLEQKATCLWLFNLPILKHTSDLKKETMALPKKERERLHYLSPGKDRAKLRSKTYQGLADAMAEQWG